MITPHELVPPPDRLTAVDLNGLPEAHRSALRREAIRRGISLADLVAELVHGATDRLLSPRSGSEASPRSR